MVGAGPTRPQWLTYLSTTLSRLRLTNRDIRLVQLADIKGGLVKYTSIGALGFPLNVLTLPLHVLLVARSQVDGQEIVTEHNLKLIDQVVSIADCLFLV